MEDKIRVCKKKKLCQQHAYFILYYNDSNFEWLTQVFFFKKKVFFLFTFHNILFMKGWTRNGPRAQIKPQFHSSSFQLNECVHIPTKKGNGSNDIRVKKNINFELLLEIFLRAIDDYNVFEMYETWCILGILLTNGR